MGRNSCGKLPWKKSCVGKLETKCPVWVKTHVGKITSSKNSHGKNSHVSLHGMDMAQGTDGHSGADRWGRMDGQGRKREDRRMVGNVHGDNPQQVTHMG